MSKQHSEGLFQLIHSLSKSEKRAFKLFVDRSGNKGKKVIRIFDRVARQQQYDERKILRKEKGLTGVQMPNLKAHLYQLILQSLAASGTNRSAELKVTFLLDQARILYNKCLYNECLKILVKAKKSAKENDTRILLLEILELEKLALRQTVQEGNPERVETIISETSRTTESIRNINTFSNLALKLNSLYQRTGFIRSQKDLGTVQKFFNESMPPFREEELSFHEKLYLYYSYSGYYFFIQDFHSGYEYARKWVALYDEEPEMKYRKPELYIRALNSLLAVQYKLGLYGDFLSVQKILAALKRDPRFDRTENLNLNLFKTIYLHEINRHFMTGEFTAGTRIVRKLESELTRFIPKLDRHTVLIFYYKIACLYFGAGNFRSSVRWLSRIINEKEINLREDLHAFARIIRLIAYFELGETDLVESSIRSTYRFVRRQGTLEKYFGLIIGFLRESPRLRDEETLKEAFIRLKSGMESLRQSPFEKRAFIYFDMISWLDSRIGNRPVEEIIRRKIRPAEG